ncbi:hypothetical protein D9757_005441 [Collybiopsis confluens]|uniref:C2H2-type domain-containing protein n=1 Tax=Collybiopsis confluens TaxID=2823264 RepID=A0A8H5M9F4_9AGAR|nr:hypothetical protein D9757_005441 [Collybiopsis confluens]
MTVTVATMLPSVLPAHPGLSDASATPEQLEASKSLAKVTRPHETAIFICALPGILLRRDAGSDPTFTLSDCFKLFPSRERLAMHRKREHREESSEESIITWNSE